MNHLVPCPDTPAIHGTVNQWLESGFARDPSAPALVLGNQTLSYRDLDQITNRMARYLNRQGVKPGDCVGLCLSRSIEMVASLIGILKAGAAYVPLDPAYPVDRLAVMVEDARVQRILVHGTNRTLFASENVLVWEEVCAEIEREGSDPLDAGIGPESLADVLFTSGSPGRPKGIAMPHRALANLIEWQLERKTFVLHARVLQYSSISFDVSFQEIATTLASGGTLYLIADEDRRDPRKLLDALMDQRIARLFLPYVAMRSMIETALATNRFPETLKEVVTAGEQLRVDAAVRRFFETVGNATLDNQYGPSESHVVTAELLEGDPAEWPDLPSIGLPLKNCGTCILDEEMQPVEPGVTGELYLAGRNLAHGYIHRDELTEQVFVPNPFDVPERPMLYKTGDLATYLPDGRIEFMGRRDFQIKILGHRIEPGEINNAAASCPGVAQCLTHAVSNEADIKQLAAYYTVKEGASVAPAGLREHLAAKLPDYMVPAFLIKLDKIPYTPSGKVDLKALPKPSIENSIYAGEAVHYTSETEAVLAAIWGALLGLDAIPRSADFFELGGDSLRAVTLFLKIQERFGKELPLSTLMHASSLAALAALIDGESDTPDLSGYRALKMLQSGREGVEPLFLMHGGQGNVLVYNGFVRMLGPEHPVYAFQWPGWDGRPGPADIRRMARIYCEELVRFYPAGPIRLGGYCIGGMIAIELVRELEAAGRTVRYPLVVWDSPNLESRHYRRDEPWDSATSIEAFNRMKAGLESIRLDTGDHYEVPKSDYVPPSGKAAKIRKIPGLIQLLRIGKQLRQDLRTLPLRRRIFMTHLRGGAIPMEWRADHCLRSMVKAVRRHRSSPFRGDMLYFRSDCVVGRYFGLPGWWDDPFLGFAELCAGNFEAHAIGGSHTDVLDIPEMGDIVKQALQSEGNA